MIKRKIKTWCPEMKFHLLATYLHLCINYFFMYFYCTESSRQLPYRGKVNLPSAFKRMISGIFSTGFSLVYSVLHEYAYSWSCLCLSVSSVSVFNFLSHTHMHWHACAHTIVHTKIVMIMLQGWLTHWCVESALPQDSGRVVKSEEPWVSLGRCLGSWAIF